MPKIKKLTTFSNEKFTPYLKITNRSLQKIDTLKSQDKNNLTGYQRNLSRYEEKLHLNNKHNPGLIDLIKQRYLETQQPIKLLDSGCGSAQIIDQLLSTQTLNNALGECTGISLHYFNNVKTVLEKQGKRFKYYSGTVEATLVNISNEFDFIIDVCGAYLYSVDKLNLLAKFHQALKPGGTCYIRNCGGPIHIQDSQNKMSPLSHFLPKYFPNTFQVQKHGNDNGKVIVMTKTSARFPIPAYDANILSERSTLPELSSFRHAKRGNAVCPDHVQFTLAQEPKMTLRTLCYKQDMTDEKTTNYSSPSLKTFT